jgi:nucleotide-binding universal stress UspA family protein
VRQGADGRPAPAPTAGLAGAGGSSLDAVLAYAGANDIPVEPISFVSRDVADDIAEVAQARQVNLVLMGFHRPVIGQAILGGTVHRVMTSTASDVAVFVDRGLERKPARILVPYLGGMHDRFALSIAERLARSSAASVTVLHVVRPRRADNEHALNARQEVDRVYTDPATKSTVQFRVVEHDSPVAAVLEEAAEADLVVIGVAEQWDMESHLFGWRSQRIARDCPTSLLIVRKSPLTVSRLTPAPGATTPLETPSVAPVA